MNLLKRSRGNGNGVYPALCVLRRARRRRTVRNGEGEEGTRAEGEAIGWGESRKDTERARKRAASERGVGWGTE
eukprot:1912322-Rhodomonas_salina.1